MLLIKTAWRKSLYKDFRPPSAERGNRGVLPKGVGRGRGSPQELPQGISLPEGQEARVGRDKCSSEWNDMFNQDALARANKTSFI